MGSVYQAEHVGLGIEVAIKMLGEGFFNDPKAIGRFKREARSAAAIQHPNVVRILDTGEADDGTPYIAMERLRGESLSSLLRRHRKLPLDVMGKITFQILEGLRAAHKKDIVHRDLKPGNIYLAKQNDDRILVKLLDFGISKSITDEVSNLTLAGSVVGTPRFMAPEQARGAQDIDARADLYAVGVLVYRMTTGRLPFSGSTQREIVAQIIKGNYDPPRQVNPEIPLELEKLLIKALKTNKEHRFQDEDAFAAHLKRICPAQDDPIDDMSIILAPHENDFISSDRNSQTRQSITGSKQASSGSNLSLSKPRPGRGSSERYAALSNSQSGHSSQISGLHPSQSTERPTVIESPLSRRHTQLEYPIHRPIRRLLFVFVFSLMIFGGGLFLVKDSRSFLKSLFYNVKTPITVGINKYMPAAMIEEDRIRMTKHISRTLKRPVNLVIFDDYVSIAKKLAQNDVQLAVFSAFAYVQAKQDYPNIKLIARHVTQSGESYQGYIVSKPDSGIRHVADLKGKKFCFVNPNSTSGYLYPRAALRRNNIDPDRDFDTAFFTGNHVSALGALQSGACDAAAIFSGIFAESDKHGFKESAFHVILTTDRIPFDAYCVSKEFPADLTKKIRESLLSLKAGSDYANKVLGPDGTIRGFVPADDHDYDPVRDVELSLRNKKKK